MARITKRKGKDISVPTLAQDAAERKRLLNVLAQRRYRERKRQRYEELESKTSSHTNTEEHGQPISNDASTAQNETLLFPSHDSDVGNDFTWDTSVLFPSLHTPEDVSWTALSSSPSIYKETGDAMLTPPDSLDFPDEIYIPMLELNILKAGVAIARRLDIESVIWDLSSLSPFNHSTNLNYDHLPVNLRPTFMQLTVPHHPVLDILPWPEVRDKLILVFSQPENLRPPTARSSTAMIGFVYDMEDTAEGIRVTGDDPYATENWELGEKVFSKWWWAFTKEIIDHSNAVREARGATTLTGMVLGEVT